MIRRICFVVVLTAMLTISQNLQAQDGRLLRYDFPQDEPVIYRTTTEMSQTMQVGGQSFENKVTQTEINTLSLVGMTEEKNFTLRHTNERLSVKAELGPAGNYNYDSESAELEKGTALSNALNPVYETLSGMEYEITLTPRGTVKDLKGYQETIKALTKDKPLAAQFTGGGSEQAQKESLAEIFFGLSEQPVAEDDTWEVPFSMDLPKIGKAKGKRIYKFLGPITADNPKVVRISVSLEVDFDFNLNSQGTIITGNLGVDSSQGEVRFDTEKGQVISASLEYTLSGEMNVETGDDKRKITIEQKQKRSTNRLSDLPN